MEFAVQSNVIRGLSKQQYQVLKELCQYSNNLYNIRQYFFNEKKFLTYESNYHECKKNENYTLLQAGIAQQTLKVADRSFKSFFNLLKKCKTGDYRYHDVKIPHYRKKGGYFNLILSTNAISIVNGYFKIPISREYRKLHPDMEDILIPYPERLNGAELKEVRICPHNNGRYFKIQYVYHWYQEKTLVNPDNIMAIDLGVDIDYPKSAFQKLPNTLKCGHLEDYGTFSLFKDTMSAMHYTVLDLIPTQACCINVYENGSAFVYIYCYFGDDLIQYFIKDYNQFILAFTKYNVLMKGRR